MLEMRRLIAFQTSQTQLSVRRLASKDPRLVRLAQLA
jgi:hypothetical protein